MSRLIRIAIGFALFAGGLTFLAYGIAQAIENGNCGTDKYGRTVGPPCPTGFGPMIGLMVLGAFVALGGAALTSRRGSQPGMAVFAAMLRFFGATAVAAIGAAVLGIVDVHPDDTRPGIEIVWLVSGSVLLVSLPGLLRGDLRKRDAGLGQPTAFDEQSQQIFGER